MTRSPVNSTNFWLRMVQRLRKWGTRGFGQASVQLHAARQVQMPVDLALRWGHLQDDGIVDPIAGCVRAECPVGDGGRERKRRWIKLGKLKMEIYREDIAS